MAWGEKRADKQQGKQDKRQFKVDEQRRLWEEAGIVFAVTSMRKDKHTQALTIYKDRVEVVRSKVNAIIERPDKQIFPLRSITGVEVDKGKMFGKLTIFASGRSFEVDGVLNQSLDAARDAIFRQQKDVWQPAPAPAAPSEGRARPDRETRRASRGGRPDDRRVRREEG